MVGPPASMGPRLKDVEDELRAGTYEKHIQASMGPRLKDVEDIANINTAVPVLELQWGHVSRTWKTSPVARGDRIRVAASMGPRLKDVEDKSGSHEANRATRCFNGATSQGRGRRDDGRHRRRPGRRASMGPRLKDVEDSSRW